MALYILFYIKMAL